MRRFLPLASLLLVAACAAKHREHARAEPAAARDPLAELFPTPSRGLAIPFDPKTPYALAHLVDDWSDASGWALLASAPTRDALAATPLGLNRALAIAPRDAQRFVEEALVQHGFALALASTAPPRVLRVLRMEGREAELVRASARAVREDELDAWAAHPAFSVTTTVALEHADPRELGNALRARGDDPDVHALVPLSGGHVLLLGPAPWVAATRAVLRGLDAGAAR